MVNKVHYCGECGGKMTYDSALSKRKKFSVWWCMDCKLIEHNEQKDVVDPVNSVRRYIFKGEFR